MRTTTPPIGTQPVLAGVAACGLALLLENAYGQFRKQMPLQVALPAVPVVA